MMLLLKLEIKITLMCLKDYIGYYLFKKYSEYLSIIGHR